MVASGATCDRGNRCVTAMRPVLREFADAEQFSQAAAEALVQVAATTTAAQGRFTWVLTGGHTPKRLYELLANAPFKDRVPWDKVEFFWGDERAVPPEHAESNFRLAREALLNKLRLKEEQIHRMPAERDDLENAAWDYQIEIARVFGTDPEGKPPSFDLILLGMGADGHTASLFPHTEAVKEETRWVTSNYVPKLDRFRLTFTARLLNRAARVWFLVAGDNKADALAQVLEGPSDPVRLPAQLVQPQAGELIWFIDAAAAGKLAPHPGPLPQGERGS
jgi:6-phosphogluconolactonase